MELAGHAEQVPEPTPVLYVPARHAEHDSPSDPVYPALHWQLVGRLLPLGEIEFAAQEVHSAEPELVLYFPGTQATQVAPSAPVDPGLHRQSVRNADAADELELAGQSWQVGLPISDHVPGPHSLHVSLPVAPVVAEYKPPAHLEHSYRSVMLS